MQQEDRRNSRKKIIGFIFRMMKVILWSSLLLFIRNASSSSLWLGNDEKGVIAFIPSSSSSASTLRRQAQQRQLNHNNNHLKEFSLSAKPKRFDDNVDGVVYVNDRCINCAACSNFAPATFKRATTATSRHHIVYQQPTNEQQIKNARAALAACPVAAIRVESFAERNHAAKISSSRGDSHNDSNETDNSNTKNSVVWTEQDEFLSKEMSLSSKLNTHGRPFPRPLFDDPRIDIHWVGYHNERSFGATPYIVSSSQKDNSNNKWIMVDTPKYCTNSVDAVLEVTGGVPPDYLFLTHVDDTADHNLWKHHFPSLQRIFHSGDLGVENWLGDTTLDDVEVLLPSIASTNNSIGLASYSLDGKVIDYDEWMSKSNDASSHDDDVIILHTPGHSKGSIMLYKRQLSKESNYNGVLFTGDTYAYTATPQGGRRMTSFPRYCNSRSMQAKTMPKLLQLQWDIIAPGHGHPRDYRAITDPSQKKQIQMNEMQDAIQELNVAVPKFASTL